jgi:hypothetical protein
LKDEPASGLDCSGEFKAAPDIRQSGPAAGSGYLLRNPPKVKLRGTEARPLGLKGQRVIHQNQAFSWQEWQGSNLRPPVLEVWAASYDK